MSLADIKAKITAEAKSQVDAILEEGKKRSAALAKDADEQIRGIQNSWKERFAKEEPEVARRREIVARLDAARVDLGVRQRIVGEAFDGALRQLADLPKDKYLSFVRALLEKAGAGNEAVLVGKNERYIDAGWISEYNASHQANLVLSDERLPITGGFVLRQGKIDVNCSWDMLVRDIRPDLEADAVKRLFSQGG
jgi:V/A-type H+-transporting ATPase subunit E